MRTPAQRISGSARSAGAAHSAVSGCRSTACNFEGPSGPRWERREGRLHPGDHGQAWEKNVGNQGPRRSSGSCSTAEAGAAVRAAPPLSFPAHDPPSRPKRLGRSDLCSVPEWPGRPAGRGRPSEPAWDRAASGPPLHPGRAGLQPSLRGPRTSAPRFRSDPPASWFRLGTTSGREGGAAGRPGANSGRAAEWGPCDAGDRERREREPGAGPRLPRRRAC